MNQHVRFSVPPRFMNDTELRAYFGLSERALNRLRCTPTFPRKDKLTNRTDRRAVDLYFDRRAGIVSSASGDIPVAAIDREENFDD